MKPLMEPPAASSSGLTRALKLVFGFSLLIFGALLSIPGIPGPGIAVILLGLWVLRDHFEWARRAFQWINEKTARFRRSKKP